jgi:outer membrane protein assembly factor BamB
LTLKKMLTLALCAAVLAGTAIQTRAAHAAGGPVVTSLSTGAAERSGRFLIAGSGFGAERGAVTVGGVAAPVSRWSDTQINAYVPEGAALGTDDVAVTAGGAAADAVELSVLARQQNGRAKWRIALEGNYVLQRPAVAPDGTVAVVDSYGDLYAVSPNGGLRWIVPFAGGAGVPSFGADGTLYVSNGPSIKAYAPDGTLKWTFTEPSDGQGIMAGPTVGPDGNIFAMTDFGGLGALALSPAGQLLWSNQGSPQLSEYGESGAEVVFGSGQLYGAFDGVGVSFASLWAFSLGGSQKWSRPAAGSDDPFMQQQRQPAVGPDGTVYLTGMGGANGWSLYAFDPASGSLKWNYSPYPANGMSPPSVGSDGTIYLSRSLAYLEAVKPTGASKWLAPFDGSIVDNPQVSPANDIVVAGDRPNFGEPGSVRAYSAADGSPKWQLDLPSENGSYQMADTAFRFAADGRTAYVGTSLPGNPSAPDQYSYLYAIDTTGSAPPPPPPPSNQPPTISVTHTVDGSGGWNKRTPVAVAIAASDPDDGLAAKPACTDSRNAGAPVALNVSGTASPYSTLVSGDGTHAISCTISDKSGASSSAKDTVNLDATAPAIGITHRRILGGYTITVTASDATSGLSTAPACTDNAGPLALTKSGSAWTATVKTRGRHTIRCSVSDKAGWSSTATDSFTN